MIAVLTMSEQTIKVVKLNKDKLTASQLAQEGLELVRNKRDNNWLATGYNWKLGAGAGTASDIVQSDNNNRYVIDYSGNIITSGVSDINSDAANLKIDASSFHWHGAGTATIFSRLIEITNNQSNYIEVNCTVRWREKAEVHDYMATMALYDWR
jgi:hypothetical protein